MNICALIGTTFKGSATCRSSGLSEIQGPIRASVDAEDGNKGWHWFSETGREVT